MSIRIGGFEGPPNHLAVDESAGTNGVWIEPVPDQLISGDIKRWAEVGNIQPVKIPGYWYYAADQISQVDKPATPGEKIILFLHGGAYVACSAHPQDGVGVITRALVNASPIVKVAFSVEYRLSSGAPLTAANPFPAAIVDALSGYRHLRQLGYSPENIIVAGDSAGGNLALALTRYLLEFDSLKPAVPANEPHLGIPGALILLSPWSDLDTGLKSHPETSSNVANLKSDFLQATNGPFLLYAVNAFVGQLDKSELSKNRYISPGSPEATDVNFKGFPRAFIASGDAEICLDGIRLLRDRMVADLGKGDTGVTYHESVDSIHDYIFLEWHEPQRTQTLREIAAWLDRIYE